MANNQISSSAILPQEPSIQLLSQDQVSIQGPQEQQSATISLYSDQAFHHHHHHHQDQLQLDDMTHEYLIQNIPTDPSQGSQSLLHIPNISSTSPAAPPSSSTSSSAVNAAIAASSDIMDDELNIYDYIHAKQEDEDEHEGDSNGHVVNHEQGPDSDSLSSSLVPSDNVAGFPSSSSSDEKSPNIISHNSMRQSPVSTVSSPVLSAYSPSSPTFSALSPSPSSFSSSSSDIQNFDHTSEPVIVSSSDVQVQQDSDILGSIQIKQECLESASLLGHHSGYMDTSMDLYGPTHSPLLSSQSDLMPSPQDLFRVLMEELQNQASIQREKFFTATTGSGTGMDSVEFLFNGPQTQEQNQLQAQIQKPVQHTMAEATANPCMLSTNFKLGSAGHESDNMGLISELTKNNDNLSPLDPAHSSASDSVSVNLLTHGNVDGDDDVIMETTEPDGDMPSSPIDSSSSSSRGSITPELASPVLSSSFASPSRTSQKAEVVRVAFTRFSGQRSKTNENEAIVEHPTRALNDSVPAIVSSITELSFHSVLENGKPRRRTAESVKEESSSPTVITMQPAPRKKRKLSRNSDDQGSPRLSAFPSPPSSVRTTPPLQPTNSTSAVEGLSLSPPFRGQDSVDSELTEPVTPTSPLLPKSVIKLEAMTADVIMRSLSSAMETDKVESLRIDPSPDQTKPLTPNANNKRPWTGEEEKLLLKLVENRTPIKDIAETLNRSVHSVRSRRQVLTDPGFVKGNGHAQPRRSKPDPSSKLPTYSQMAFLSLARLPDLQGTLNDVASMVEMLFSRYLNRIPRTGHKNLQIWRAQISDALAHEKGHPRPRFESFGVKRGRQWVYRLTDFGKGVMNAMGSVDQICEDLLKNNEMAGGGSNCGPDGESSGPGGAGAGLGQGNGYGYSYCPETTYKTNDPTSPKTSSDASSESGEEISPDNVAASNAIANAMAAMAAGLAAMTAAEEGKLVGPATHFSTAVPAITSTATSHISKKGGPSDASTCKVQAKEKTGRTTKSSNTASSTVRSGRKAKA
ncbi:hypothetical protein BGZ76_005025 [Entomortierella beljakovae]|nr:hypothetical protein BGZ76_005025 [Entomortierella beljakovae]